MVDLSAYHARLPYGERLSPTPALESPFFPFDGDIRCRPLAEPIVPEPPRRGEPGGEPCEACAEPEKFAIWRDSRWILSSGFEPIGLPMVALLMPVEHVTHTVLLSLPRGRRSSPRASVP